jgi:kynurenine formamidase
VRETIETGGRRIEVYDLSHPLSNRTALFEPNRHKIVYFDADQSVKHAQATVGLGPEHWPGGRGFHVETVTLSTHSGTHVDAPYHYGPRPDGRLARTIDQVPLRWCIGDGVRVDVRHCEPVRGITRHDVEAALDGMGYSLRPYDIVLLWTDASRHFETAGYHRLHAGLRREATAYLLDAGVRLIGIDAWSLDRPVELMVEEAKAGDQGQLWESHLLGREREYCQIEKLCRLSELPRSHGFTVSALPVNVEGASAGWARVVALVEIEGAASASPTS